MKELSCKSTKTLKSRDKAKLVFSIIYFILECIEVIKLARAPAKKTKPAWVFLCSLYKRVFHPMPIASEARIYE